MMNEIELYITLPSDYALDLEGTLLKMNTNEPRKSILIDQRVSLFALKHRIATEFNICIYIIVLLVNNNLFLADEMHLTQLMSRDQKAHVQRSFDSSLDQAITLKDAG